MNGLLRTLLLVSLAVSPLPLFAQDAAEDGTGEATAGAELDMGQEVGEEELLGELYLLETHGDWEIRCIRSAEQSDPCQMHQSLTGPEGTAVSEFSMFPLPEEDAAAAGATIAAPLMTLLTEQLTLSVDGGPAKRYGFSWCDTEGCYARVGFTEGDISAFRSGKSATLTLVPVVAPDQKIHVLLSLNGFTSAFNALSAR